MVSKRTTGTRTQELIKEELAHLVRPFGIVGATPKLVWERGEGAKLWDVDGKEYIDMSSGRFQYMSLGWNRQELVNAACEQMKKISQMVNGEAFSSEIAIKYAKELAEVLPGDINHVLFTNSGTDCTEGAVKMARLYWKLKGQEGKYKILCLSDAYHGASHFAASLLGVSFGRAPFGVEFPGIVRMPHYHCYRCPYGLKYPSCDILCARMVEQFIKQEGEETIACMIAEPIQGYGGFLWPPDEYWPMVKKILSDHNILLVADEVQNGFARTGKMFAMEHWNVVPDLMTMAKGINSAYLPLGAIGIGDKVYKGLSGSLLLYGGTTHGNPVALATGRAALKIYKEEKLVARSAKLGEHIHQRLVKEFLPLPCVDDVMGKGCYQSFAIALNKTTGSKFNQEAQNKVGESLDNQLMERGVIARIEHNRRMAITPPLVIGEDELDAGLDVMLDLMKKVKPV
jgi:adenosylmethionine-8-amino-7-oxononanoate aminotransferase